MRPANTVGGDYFDVIELGERHVALAMGDVAGKGMPAALLMALLQGSLRTLLTRRVARGGPDAHASTSTCYANIPSNRLITLFYAEYDPFTGSLRYVNGGHNAPYVLRPGGVERLHATGVALGIVPDAVYEVLETTLEPGDRLFLFTDGITEAFDALRERVRRGAPRSAPRRPARARPARADRERARGRARLLREHPAPGRHDHDARRALTPSPPRRPLRVLAVVTYACPSSLRLADIARQSQAALRRAGYSFVYAGSMFYNELPGFTARRGTTWVQLVSEPFDALAGYTVTMVRANEVSGAPGTRPEPRPPPR